MSDSRVDEQLVVDHISGDRTALAGIYDRYADMLYDTAAVMLRDRDDAADAVQDVFLIAAERLIQLRDPTRLKPWLFAILRNQVYTRTKRRGRSTAVDFAAPEAPEMAAPIDDAAEGGTLAYAELAELVRNAAAGLDARDQLALEYSVRGDLSGEDLADALGVSLSQSYVVLHRMRERVERAIGAFTVARVGRGDCHDLAAILAGWDGTFDVLVRKRVARHVESCATCEETSRRFAVIPMMSAAPALAAPAALRDRVLERLDAGGSAPATSYGFGRPDGFPDVPSRRRPLVVAVAVGVAALVLVIAAVVLSVAGGGDTSETDARASVTSSIPSDASAVDPEVTPAGSAPPTDGATVSSTVAPAGNTVPSATAPATSTAAVVPGPTSPPIAVPAPTPAASPAPTPLPLADGELTVSAAQIDFGSASNAGSVTLANRGGRSLDWSLPAAAPFSAVPAGGTLGPGQSVVVQVVLDRSGAGEGPLASDVPVGSSARGGGTIRLVGLVDRAPVVRIAQSPPTPTCPPIAVPLVVASVQDTTIATVTLAWSGPGAPGSAAMSRNGDLWSAPFGVDYVDGAWNYVVTARDAAGNVTAVSGSTVVQCPVPG